MNVWAICKVDTVHFPYYLIDIFTSHIINEIVSISLFLYPQINTSVIQRGAFSLTCR